MFVTNWISTIKIQKISEITNFFRHYFLSRTEVVIAISFKYRTHYTNVFRKWLTDKVKEQHPPVFISCQTKDLYGC